MSWNRGKALLTKPASRQPFDQADQITLQFGGRQRVRATADSDMGGQSKAPAPTGDRHYLGENAG